MIQRHDENITQDQHGLGVHVTTSAPVDVRNVCVSDGAIFWQEISPNPGAVTLTNVWNKKATGKYAVMVWPPGDEKHQTAVPKFVWDNTNCQHNILQSPYEAAFRIKCDDAHIIGVRFYGAVDHAGHPIKQVVQIRHGKKFVFEGCVFLQSWPDIGQQQVAGQGYVKSQHVGMVTFDRCTFTKANGHLVYSRQPGVDRIEFVNCVDPSGRKFSAIV